MGNNKTVYTHDMLVAIAVASATKVTASQHEALILRGD
jgi:hypothetical protein